MALARGMIMVKGMHFNEIKHYCVFRYIFFNEKRIKINNSIMSTYEKKSQRQIKKIETSSCGITMELDYGMSKKIS